jgi:CBS domain-containing protein
MKIKNIMNKKVKYLTPQITIQDAALAMSMDRFSAFPVVEDNGQLVGVLTRKNIITRVIAKGQNPKRTKVKEVMTLKVHHCHENDTLEQAAKLLTLHHIQGMPVLNDKHKLVGFVEMSDFVQKSKNGKLWHSLASSLHRAL